MIEKITGWIDEAGQKKSSRNQALYIGLMCEEMAETLREIYEADHIEAVEFLFVVEQLECASKILKSGAVDDVVKKANQAELIDGMCDLIWVSAGAGHMTGDIQGAFAEVARSNWSKFVEGKALFDKNGKVMKSPSYSPPILHPFVK